MLLCIETIDDKDEPILSLFFEDDGASATRFDGQIGWSKVRNSIKDRVTFLSIHLVNVYLALLHQHVRVPRQIEGGTSQQAQTRQRQHNQPRHISLTGKPRQNTPAYIFSRTS